MRTLVSLIFAFAIVLCSASPSFAQKPLAYATSPVGGLQHSIGLAISKIASERTGLQVRIIPHGGSTQYLPLIDRGELDVGITANVEAVFAYNGQAWFKGNPLKNLRVVGSAVRFDDAIAVRADSKIEKLEDLKGQTMTVGWQQHKIAHVFYMANLASAGMSEDDFTGIPVPHLGRAAQLFMEGKVAGVMLPIGAGKTREVDAKVGGIRFLSAYSSPEALERIRKIMPGAYVTELKPGSKPRPGLLKPTTFVSADYVIVAGKHVDDEAIYKLTKTLHQSKDRLVQTLKTFESHDPANMAKDFGYPYHPGAIKYYKEQGLWPPKN